MRKSGHWQPRAAGPGGRRLATGLASASGGRGSHATVTGHWHGHRHRDGHGSTVTGTAMPCHDSDGWPP
eukprot:482454-Rhodomonas_salina.1